MQVPRKYKRTGGIKQEGLGDTNKEFMICFLLTAIVFPPIFLFGLMSTAYISYIYTLHSIFFLLVLNLPSVEIQMTGS